MRTYTFAPPGANLCAHLEHITAKAATSSSGTYKGTSRRYAKLSMTWWSENTTAPSASNAWPTAGSK